MIRPDPKATVYLYADPVDMRKSIDGLAALVEQEMALSPFYPAMFVFCHRGIKSSCCTGSATALCSGINGWKSFVFVGLEASFRCR